MRDVRIRIAVQESLHPVDVINLGRLSHHVFPSFLLLPLNLPNCLSSHLLLLVRCRGGGLLLPGPLLPKDDLQAEKLIYLLRVA
nr:hypothetical protein CFP56_30998 [Quercus suber]